MISNVWPSVARTARILKNESFRNRSQVAKQEVFTDGM